MGVITTRRLAELREECDKAGVPYLETDGRLELFDRLRAHLGADLSMEIDPMKAVDLKQKIKWELAPEDGRYDGIAAWLTPAYRAEPKLDGVRLRMVVGLTGNSLISGRRSVKTFAYTQRTDNFPHLRDAVVPELAGTILDCELLAPSGKITTESGIVTNSLLNASVAITNCDPLKSQRVQARHGKAQLHVFDVLAVPGREESGEEGVLDLARSGMSYRDRRMIVEDTVLQLHEAYPDAEIHLVPQWEATEESITRALEEGYEGVMLKTLDGPYELGKRSKHWNKVKTMSTADAFIVGYNPGENANEGMVGSLNLAVWTTDVQGFRDEDVQPTPSTHEGKRVYRRAIAQVGNLTAELRKDMTAEDGSLKPEWYGQVVEFMAQGIGKNGRARHANLVRLRPDKTMADCGVDQLDVFPAV